jgi:hemerythrin-like domain-containing protein
METVPLTPEYTETLRRRRAELRSSMSALEQALAAPAPGRLDYWAQRVHVALVELSADLREHVHVTEGPQGLYRDVLSHDPRLAGPIQRLTREHVAIREALDDLLECCEPPVAGDVDRIRDGATALVSQLLRHRQRGSDLMYEAYQVDLGGDET